MEPIAVIDFETTGMSPGHTCRATEIAAVIVEDGRIVARYQNLMNSGAYVPPFIESLTGISNAMLRKAPPAAEVMAEVAEFVGRTPLVAHNASFDQKFWDAGTGLGVWLSGGAIGHHLDQCVALPALQARGVVMIGLMSCQQPSMRPSVGRKRSL